LDESAKELLKDEGMQLQIPGTDAVRENEVYQQKLETKKMTPLMVPQAGNLSIHIN